jgi:hypothetical protein
MAQSADDAFCPNCHTEASVFEHTAVATGYQCAKHGRFLVTFTVREDTLLFLSTYQQWEDAWEKAKERDALLPLIHVSDFPKSNL